MFCHIKSYLFLTSLNNATNSFFMVGVKYVYMNKTYQLNSFVKYYAFIFLCL